MDAKDIWMWSSIVIIGQIISVRLNIFFQIMRQAKLTINLMKSEFGKATLKYLGHIVGQGQVRPLDAKIQTIAKFPIPTSWKEFARFLGMAGYYRNFCLNFSEIAGPLSNFLIKKVKFVWTDDCQLAFHTVITPKIPCYEKSRLRETFLINH